MVDWRELYSSAVNESNPVYLDLLLQKTETAIFFRIHELNQCADGYFERREISEALRNMLNLRIEKLGWPDIRTT
jgi:hypothetical protein